MIRRALISVSDKTGLIELGKALKHFQIEILSTGGTAKLLSESDVPTTSISDYTGFPEMMDGRLKTLHPKVFAGILGRRNDEKHNGEAETYGVKWIDLVVVNLYPFEDVAGKSGKPSWEELVENIDIGGVALIRAAAKNHESVLVVTSPKDYGRLIQKLKDSQNFDPSFRYEMAAKAFKHTAVYDSVISETLSAYSWDGEQLQTQPAPTYHSVHGRLQQPLRYGENPHQKAAHYRIISSKEISPFSESLQGKELSFNNLLDVEAAWNLMTELPTQSCAIMKHNSPCGVAIGNSALESFSRALESDPESAFGGIVAVSGEVDSDLANLLSEHFFEIICAESFSLEAREILQRKKNLRLILLPRIQELRSSMRLSSYLRTQDVKRVSGGYLLQESDHLALHFDGVLGAEVSCATKRQPTEAELQGLKFAWVVAKNCKSNAVVIADEKQTLGIGCGEVNRKFASEAAALRAASLKPKSLGSVKVCGSDGFFPFADSIEFLKKAGVTAIVQPGGSIRDAEVIAACDDANLSMLFTKSRHFLH